MIHALPADLGEWGTLPFFSEDWPRIAARIAAEREAVLPPAAQRFAALQLTPPETVRVVILGQDPYPTPGHAHGLAFSVAPDVAPLPRSLGNIFKEMYDDLDAMPETGDLRFWARQGVLLLNTSLSVPAGRAGGHADLGWDALVRQVLRRMADRPRAFVLWGAKAQAFRPLIVADAGPAGPASHLIVQSAHPSPLSARRGFFGSRPFSTVNKWLTTKGEPPIDWTGRPRAPEIA